MLEVRLKCEVEISSFQIIFYPVPSFAPNPRGQRQHAKQCVYSPMRTNQSRENLGMHSYIHYLQIEFYLVENGH